jgi:hypothetical protein
MYASIMTMIRYEDNDKNTPTELEAPAPCAHKTFNPILSLSLSLSHTFYGSTALCWTFEAFSVS